MGRILQAPLWLFIFGVLFASIYAWAEKIQNIGIAVPLIMFLIIILYFVGRLLVKSSDNAEEKGEEVLIEDDAS